MRAHCTICSELFDGDETNPVAAIHGCGHTFHDSCLARWLDLSETCPQCRKHVPQNGIIHKLYFVQPVEEADESSLSKLLIEVQAGKVENKKLEEELASQRLALTLMSEEKNKLAKKIKAIRTISPEVLEFLSKKDSERKQVLEMVRQTQSKATNQRENMDTQPPVQTVGQGDFAEGLLPIRPKSQKVGVAPNGRSLYEYANEGSTLIIADSRVLTPSSNLREDLVAEGIHPDNIQVAVFKDAGLQDAYNLAQPLIDQVNPDLIIITAGIFSITEKINNETSLRLSDFETATSCYYDSMDYVFSHAEEHHPDVDLVFAPLTGIDLTVYNNRTEPHPQQELLHDIIIEINSDVRRFNYNNEAVTPWTASLVHKYRKGWYYYNYQHLSDGCHLSATASAYWARQLAKAIDSTFAEY